MSPGFRVGGTGAPSYELKFRIDAAKAESILDWARDRLEPDEHADPALDGAYLVHTLYLDTAALDVYHRAPSFRRRKFRVRRYGNDAVFHLEQKTRTGDRVSKRRTPVDGEVLDAMMTAAAVPAEAAWTWFHHRVADRRLGPVLRITYARKAFVGSASAGSPRLTVDDAITAVREPAWSVGDAAGGTPILQTERILELKYQSSLPTPFKQAITMFALTPATLSKYRLAAAPLGLAAAPERS